MNRTGVIIVGTLFAACCFAVYFYMAKVVRPELEAFKGTDLGITEKASAGYSGILPDTVKKQIIYSSTYLNKVRNPITFVSIGSRNTEYQIIIYKIDLLPNLTIKDAVEEYKSEGGFSSGLGMRRIKVGSAVITFNPAKSIPVEKIYLELDDYEKSNLLKNDSLDYYFIEDGQFNIKYTESNIDIYTQPPKSILSKKPPVYLLFYRKKESVFLIAMSPENRIEDEHLLLNTIFPGQTFSAKSY